MLVSKMVICFTIYSMMGWLFESLHSVVKKKKWENRGFLFGPFCPIYGFGAVGISIVADKFSILESSASPFKIFVISMIGSAIIEYATHYILEKRFHARWWDYSDLPLNINGRVSVPTAVLFGLTGIFVVYVIAPIGDNLTGWMNITVAEIISLLFMAIIAGDCALTISALTDFDKRLVEFDTAVNKHMEEFVSELQENIQNRESLLEAERKKFSSQRTALYPKNVNFLNRSAIRRIKHFDNRRFKNNENFSNLIIALGEDMREKLSK